jgi:TetR/AcrR family transcriptional regulator, lmrAB and yxaGH operons repressor
MQDRFMPRVSDARHRFIATASRLFRERGYSGVGLSEIIAQSNAPKGSFYHHFPDGKEQLAEQAVMAAGGLVRSAIAQQFQNAATVEAGAAALAGQFASWFERSNFTAGCPITSIALETVPGSERLSRAVNAAMTGWIEEFAGQIRRVDPGYPEPERAALRFLVALEGGWVVARVLRSTAPILDAPSVLSPKA